MADLRGQFEADGKLRRTAVKSLAGALVMAGGLALLDPVAAALVGEDLVSRIAGLALIVGGGSVIYVVSAFILRTVSIGELRGMISRGR